jgi:N-sulfoglucosamine sulfohydrolase
MKLSELMFIVGMVLCASMVGAAERPNVLLLLADDMSWHDVGCYGNTQIKTPHIDALAGQGMRFTHAFTATAMCSPTRQQLYTGVFPVRNGAYPNHSKVHEGTKSVVHHLKAQGYRVGLMGKGHVGPPSAFPFDKPKSVASYIKDDGPFCLIFASHHPHAPWTKGDASAYPPESLKLPPYFLDTPETRVALSKYYAEVTAFDDEVGAALKALKAAGKDKNTIVIVTTEQGSQFPFGKWTCYEAGLRVGLVMRWPGHIKPGTVTGAMVQYVDVVPTLVDAAGGDPKAMDTGRPGAPTGGNGFDGRSFLSVLEGKANKHNDHVFGVHTTKGIIAGTEYPIRSIRDTRYKLIVNLNHTGKFHNVVMGSDREKYWKSWVAASQKDPAAAKVANRYHTRPEIEFFDAESDPYEMKNLAGDPAHATRIAALRQKLEAWMTQQGDKGMATEQTGRKRGPKKKKKKK